VTLFGISYISSETSAHLSSQSEVSQLITAGIWVIPVELTPVPPDQCDGESKVEPNDKKAVSNEEIQVDCGDKAEKDEGIEGEKATDPVNEEINESENVDDKADVDVNIEKEQETPVDDVETQPDAPDEVNKSNEQKPDEKKSVESKAPEAGSEKKIDEELNAIVKPEENTEKSEGDSNEKAESNEETENNEVDK